ncbi:putative cytokinetic ring protein SteA [Alkalihalobacillus sp. 1P02AB]|uniref:putative cytokinetic ring protein SteA n=1 Tax=Alkalihalobacillus sp. 1P02AB TaxID=3132260 RepID=UPI0039A4AE4E
MSNLLEGKIIAHKTTKKLIEMIPNGESMIAVLSHEDLDGVAVDGLIEKKVKAIINFKSSMSGKYEHKQVRRLLAEGIPVYDLEEIDVSLQSDSFTKNVHFIKGDGLYEKAGKQSRHLCRLIPYTEEKITERLQTAKENYQQLFLDFMSNSLEYAQKEAPLFLTQYELPTCFQMLEGKQVLIVARNCSYEKDLLAIKRKIKRENINVMAVDGAADGLLNIGVKPDFIIGDMDSVSEKALLCGAHLICHRYMSGHSPGAERVQSLNIMNWEELQFVGTSEDLAIYGAYWSKAAHLFLVGCRSGMKEFLEKGRPGMGSSILSRIQAGEMITDLKGIHILGGIHQAPIFSFDWFTQLSNNILNWWAKYNVRAKLTQGWFQFRRKKESL